MDCWDRPGGGLDGRSGGEAERGGLYRCEPRDKRESFRNRIMASCLNAPQIVCQVTAALNRHVYRRIGLRENAKTRTTKSPCAVYWDNDLATAMVTAATAQTGRRNIKQEVFWILGRALNCKPTVIQLH